MAAFEAAHTEFMAAVERSPAIAAAYVRMRNAERRLDAFLAIPIPEPEPVESTTEPVEPTEPPG
jgi:hypothetical protein